MLTPWFGAGCCRVVPDFRIVYETDYRRGFTHLSGPWRIQKGVKEGPTAKMVHSFPGSVIGVMSRVGRKDMATVPCPSPSASAIDSCFAIFSDRTPAMREVSCLRKVQRMNILSNMKGAVHSSPLW